MDPPMRVAMPAVVKRSALGCARWRTDCDRASRLRAERATVVDAFNLHLLCRDSLPWLRIEFLQARQDLLRKERDVGDRIFMVQEAALAKH